MTAFRHFATAKPVTRFGPVQPQSADDAYFCANRAAFSSRAFTPVSREKTSEARPEQTRLAFLFKWRKA